MAEMEFSRYETLRPDELEEIVRSAPVAYWPLGLIEHHGWHLPIGFDGVKAARLCERCALLTGGVLLPVMWWGGGGGHGGFKWTHYQDETAVAEIVKRTTTQLFAFGFRVVVLLCGHYPWEGILRAAYVPEAADDYPGAVVLLGTEVTIAWEESKVPGGDHAAKQETNYGLALLPELVSRDALTAGRAEGVWPEGSGVPADAAAIEGLDVDPASPRFAQLGDDPAESTFEQGERQTAAITAALVGRIRAALE